MSKTFLNVPVTLSKTFLNVLNRLYIQIKERRKLFHRMSCCSETLLCINFFIYVFPLEDAYTNIRPTYFQICTQFQCGSYVP